MIVQGSSVFNLEIALIYQSQTTLVCFKRSRIDTKIQSNYGHMPEAVVFSVDACAAHSGSGVASGLASLRGYEGNLMENWSSGGSCPRA